MLSFMFHKKWIYDNVVYEEKISVRTIFCDMVNDSVYDLNRCFHCFCTCLLYTSDAADDLLCVDLGGRGLIKKKKQTGLQEVRPCQLYKKTKK